MTVTPYVYEFTPGAKTAAAIIDGVWRVMDFVGSHHWEVVSGSYVAGSTITVFSKATPARQIRLVAVTGATQNVSIYYSVDGGVTEAPVALMGGGISTVHLASGTHGMGTSLAYVVEVEDAITIATTKGTDGGTILASPESIGIGAHIGQIFSAHNKSDGIAAIGQDGLLCGLANFYNNSAGFWLAPTTTGSGTTQGLIQNGPASWSRVCVGVSNTIAVDSRDSRNSAAQPLLGNVGDGGTIERLVPYPITGPVTGTITGHVAYTRYCRARRYGVTDTPPGNPPIANGDVFASAGAPTTIGWRHNLAASEIAAQTRNFIHIWCPPGAEINVDP